MTAWEKVEIARDPNRKTSLEYIDEVTLLRALDGRTEL